MAGSLTELSAHLYGRAKEKLQTAELLMKSGSYRQSINRFYYAIFRAIRAVNALDGFDSSKHSGVLCLEGFKEGLDHRIIIRDTSA